MDRVYVCLLNSGTLNSAWATGGKQWLVPSEGQMCRPGRSAHRGAMTGGHKDLGEVCLGDEDRSLLGGERVPTRACSLHPQW